MIRVCLLGTACLAVVSAQSPPPSDTLSSFEQAAQKSLVTWNALARDLDARVAHLLPCDPKAAAAIGEVSRASEVRLNDLNDYLRAAASNATTETNAARALLAWESSRVSENAPEQSDTSEEVNAVQKQLDALGAAMKQRPALDDADKTLQQIAEMVKQRNMLADQQAANEADVQASLRQLVAAFETREAAIKDEIAAFESERARWAGYYAARLARAQTECTITQDAAPETPAKGKSKGTAKGTAK